MSAFQDLDRRWIGRLRREGWVVTRITGTSAVEWRERARPAHSCRWAADVSAEFVREVDCRRFRPVYRQRHCAELKIVQLGEHYPASGRRGAVARAWTSA
jgi:hypothetical protein